MMIQQVEINCLNEALTETEYKSKYVSNEGDGKLWNIEADIVVSQHKNNIEVKTRYFQL